MAWQRQAAETSQTVFYRLITNVFFSTFCVFWLTRAITHLHLVSWCFERSQPLRIISGLSQTHSNRHWQQTAGPTRGSDCHHQIERERPKTDNSPFWRSPPPGTWFSGVPQRTWWGCWGKWRWHCRSESPPRQEMFSWRMWGGSWSTPLGHVQVLPTVLSPETESVTRNFSPVCYSSMLNTTLLCFMFISMLPLKLLVC